MVDTEQYLSRIKSYAEDNDPLAMQESALAVLAKLIEDVPDGTLQLKPAPGKWSVGEILAHLADDEVVTFWRYRQMIENDGCALAGFDQDEWACMGRNAAANPKESLQLFQLLRESNLRMLRNLTPEEWQRHGIHAERGRITVQDLARHMAGHDVNHIEQIRKILGK
jgi:hypothetical protein